MRTVREVERHVARLKEIGPEFDEQLTSQILDSGEAAVRPLLNLALNIVLLLDQEPECYGPIHALRLLGEMMTIPIMNELLQGSPSILAETGDPAVTTWEQDLPQILARCGAPAIPDLIELLDQREQIDISIMAGLTLTFIGSFDPTTHDTVVTTLRERLTSENPQQLSAAAQALAVAGDQASYKEIMRLFREKRILAGPFSPAIARQLLLNDANKYLKCVHHSLAERYEFHPIDLPEDDY
jgi:hypothetical protein